MRDENSYNRRLRRLHHTERIINKRARGTREACAFDSSYNWNPFNVCWEPYASRQGQLFYLDCTASHRLAFVLLVLPKLRRFPFEEVETFDEFCDKVNNLNTYSSRLWISYREDGGSIWFFASNHHYEDRAHQICKGGRWGSKDFNVFPREVFHGISRYYARAQGRRSSTAGYDPITLREIETLEECRLDEWNPWPLHGGYGSSPNPKQPNKPSNALSKRGGARRKGKNNKHHNTRVYTDKARYYSSRRDRAHEYAAAYQIGELRQEGIYGNHNPRKFTKAKRAVYSGW